MALDELVLALTRDAEERSAAIRKEAAKEAERILARASADAERVRTARLAEGEARHRQRMRGVLASAARKARGEVLEARARMLDRVFDAAAANLPELVGTERYAAAIERHLREALAYVGDDPAIVRCAPAIVPRLAELTAAAESVRVQGDPSVGPGLIVETEGGAVRIDSTLAARMQSLRAVLSIEILELLGAPSWGPSGEM